MQKVNIDTTRGVALTITNTVTAPRMSKAQLCILRGILKAGDTSKAISYLNSFIGNKDRYLCRNERIEFKAKGIDKLAEKPTGSILKLFERQFSPNTTKTPTEANKGDWIGIEIECLIPDDDENDCDGTRQLIKDAIVERRIRNVQLKSDGSIRAGDTAIGVEFTVLFQRSNPDNLKQLCELLADFNAYVNASCGLHVHLDCRDAIKGRSYRGAITRARRILNALPVLVQMQPESRLANTYCKQGMSRIRGDRYYAINLTALRKFQTIEMRLHSGSVSYSKISQWAELLYTISRERRCKEPMQTYAELSECLPTASNKLMAYVRSRIAQFNRGPLPLQSVGA